MKGKSTAVIAANDKEGDLFAFTCMSDYAAVAKSLDVPKSKLGTCINSKASQHYCLDHLKFTNYKEV